MVWFWRTRRKNQNDCSIRVPCLRLLDESDWDNAEPESPDLDLWISLGCSRGHAKASRQRDDYGEEIRMNQLKVNCVRCGRDYPIQDTMVIPFEGPIRKWLKIVGPVRYLCAYCIMELSHFWGPRYDFPEYRDYRPPLIIGEESK